MKSSDPSGHHYQLREAERASRLRLNVYRVNFVPVSEITREVIGGGDPSAQLLAAPDLTSVLALAHDIKDDLRRGHVHKCSEPVDAVLLYTDVLLRRPV